MKILSILKRIFKYLFYGIPVVNSINKKVNIQYTFPNARFLGKRIIVTGGNRGIGLAIAKKLSKEGAKVLITGRDLETLKKTAKENLFEYGVLDVTDIAKFDLFLKEAQNKLGGIDILINNAGISLHEDSFFCVTSETFDKQINTNFKGPLFLTQKFIRYLLDYQIEGNVVFISSETGETMDIRPYGFSKAAINSMVRGLAYTFAKNNIRINAVSPGVTATAMTNLSGKNDIYSNNGPAKRIYLPEEIAEAVCFIASDIANSISGQIIVCNNAKTVNFRK